MAGGVRTLRRAREGPALSTGFDDREQAAFDRVTALFAAVPADLPVGDGTWVAREVLAHLVTVLRRYTSQPRLADTPRGVDVVNAEELAALDGLAVDDLLALLRTAFADYRALWVAMPGEHRWPFHGGGTLSTSAVRANLLGELTVHGRDVATAAGREWPIGDDDAADLLAFVREVLPAYARPGTTGRVDLVPDAGAAFALVLEPAGASTGPAGTGAATVAGPAGALVLLLYQRLPLGEAAVHGLRVSGDAAVLGRVLGALEAP